MITGDRQRAVAALERAVALYESKGNLVLAERSRSRLDELAARPASTAS